MYIPEEWLIDKQKMDKVAEILDELDTDIKYEGCYDENTAIKDLNKIGETIIVEKLKNNELSFGA